MRSLLRRSADTPAALRRKFDAHERVLAVADITGGGAAVLVATQLGLWVPEEASDWRRIGWHRVVRATWTDDGLEVIEGVLDRDQIVQDLPPLLLGLSEPRTLPAVVRKRVEASIARWEQVRVPGGTARLVARRIPGQDGLAWTARLDNGTPDSPQARDILTGHLEQILASSADVESSE